jgi:hypothetical protein
VSRVEVVLDGRGLFEFRQVPTNVEADFLRTGGRSVLQHATSGPRIGQQAVQSIAGERDRQRLFIDQTGRQ